MLELPKSHSTVPIVVESYFPVSPSRMFQAWTQPDMVMKWFGKGRGGLVSAEIDLRVGGAWRFVHAQRGRNGAHAGQYLIVEPVSRLKFSWYYCQMDLGDAKSNHAEIDVFFTPKGKGTGVRLVHLPLRPEDPRDGISVNWEKALDRLKQVLLSGVRHQ